MEGKGVKLKSRKFWIAVGAAAYFGGMAIKESGADSQLASIIYGICMGAVIAIYILIEYMLDSDRIYKGDDLEEIEDEGEELG